VEEEVPSILHEAVVAWLIRVLGNWAGSRGAWVFGSEIKLAVAPQRGRKPDVAMYLPGSRLPSRSSSLARSAPTVLVEVISSRPRDARRDRIEKMQEYATFGVRFYWLLDPDARFLQILELGSDGRYTIALSASEGAHAVPGCQGFMLDLDALWTEIDRLPVEDAEANGHNEPGAPA